MIIGTCGFCSTGSSAVSDYLMEFDQNQVLDAFEFTLPYLPDGLEDLEYHLTKSISRDDSCRFALFRFRRFMNSFINGPLTKVAHISKHDLLKITNEFIDSLVQMRWKYVGRATDLLYPSLFFRYFGLSIMDQRIHPLINKVIGKNVDIYPVKEWEVSIMPSNFEEASKKFIHDILSLMGADFSKNIVLDQPFVGDDPAKSFHFFDDAVAIVVDRDPRDNYLFTKKFLQKRGRFMPVDKVENFVKYYKLLRHNRPYQDDNPRVLRLHFEDLVYNYSNTSNRINSFCNLPKNPHPFTVFDPSLSIANTQLFLRYPEYEKDIRYIEKELPEYLFNFEDYPKPNVTGKMFSGKSPLNKQ